jgi:hypothetical protein
MRLLGFETKGLVKRQSAPVVRESALQKNMIRQSLLKNEEEKSLLPKKNKVTLPSKLPNKLPLSLQKGKSEAEPTSKFGFGIKKPQVKPAIE